MAYLMNFMKILSYEEQEERVFASAEYLEWEKLREHCDMMLRKGYFRGNGRDLSDPEKLVLKKEKRLVETIWKKYQHMPNVLANSVLGYLDSYDTVRYRSRLNGVDSLSTFSECSQVRLADLREAATKLSYMVLPIDYVNRKTINDIMLKDVQERGYCSQSIIMEQLSQAKNVISDIADFTEQDLYMLCPVSFYDLCRVENDTESREMIFGGELVRVKALLDTIMQIQRNLFATLKGEEADTGVWEIGEGGGCSESELMHLQILVEMILPIQRSLLEIGQEYLDMVAWEKTMRRNHGQVTQELLHKMSKQLSWAKEARQTLRKVYAQEIKKSEKAELIIPEAAVIVDVLIFALPRGTSLQYGDGLARVFRDFGVDMPESFYLKRGFVRQSEERDCYDTEGIELAF